MKIPIRAIIFDMDGVITHSMPYHYRAWRKALAAEGVAVSRFEVYKREGQPGRETIREFLAEHGKILSAKGQKEVLEEKEKLFKKFVKSKFIKGSKRYLRALKKQGFKIAVVTGTSRKEVKKILPASIYKLFDVIITSDEVKNGKPNPEPFLKGIKKLGVAKKEAIVIENAPFGILAAKKAGLFCIALETSLPRKFLKGADLIFKSIAELNKNVHFVLAKG
ncbi:MAG: HAD family phosphatase [Candidatus Omnitrophica bacterium]|nr:HAD family phosphatase [Candidatus Omnitrophota bacterium]